MRMALSLAFCLLCGSSVFSSETLDTQEVSGWEADPKKISREFVRCAAVGDIACVSKIIKSGPSSHLDVINSQEPLHNMTALFAAAANGHTRLVDYLIAQGAQSHKLDRRGQTALGAAAYGGHIEAVRLLLRSGAKINIRPGQGPTPLLAAMQSRKIDLIELLIRYGANVDYADSYGLTPRMFANNVQEKDILRLIEKVRSSRDSESLRN